MKTVEFEGVGVDGDGTPVMGFSVEMHEGFDPKGRLRYQIAALATDGGDVIALIDPYGKPVALVEWNTTVRRFCEAVVEEGYYMGVIEYDNFAWREAGGRVEPVFAIDDAVHAERVRLNEVDIGAIREFIDHFEGTNGK